LFFNLNEYVAKLMRPWSDYKVGIEEIHHTEKKDAPSGTAITLAQDILPHTNKNTWSLNHTAPDTIGINSKREVDVKGTHSVSFTSKIDTITIKHEAHSREGFAMGAVIAAEFLLDKKGVFTMKDVLGL
jgi:4-hydroxy-tetrahydrodipicolinate reductase